MWKKTINTLNYEGVTYVNMVKEILSLQRLKKDIKIKSLENFRKDGVRFVLKYLIQHHVSKLNKKFMWLDGY